MRIVELPTAGSIIPYASRTGTRRNLDALRSCGWRLLVSASGCVRTEGFGYALDNGAWSAYTHGNSFDEKSFSLALAKVGPGSDWTVIPDIVAGGHASLSLSLQWMRRVLDVSPVALLAVQDGIGIDDVRQYLGRRVGIFVGGSTSWKLHTLRLWCALGREIGCWVHVGRVNSQRRINLCKAAGATSFDGTSASRYATSLPRLDYAVRQVPLFCGGRNELY